MGLRFIAFIESSKLIIGMIFGISGFFRVEEV